MSALVRPPHGAHARRCGPRRSADEYGRPRFRPGTLRATLPQNHEDDETVCRQDVGVANHGTRRIGEIRRSSQSSGSMQVCDELHGRGAGRSESQGTRTLAERWNSSRWSSPDGRRLLGWFGRFFVVSCTARASCTGVGVFRLRLHGERSREYWNHYDVMENTRGSRQPGSRRHRARQGQPALPVRGLIVTGPSTKRSVRHAGGALGRQRVVHAGNPRPLTRTLPLPDAGVGARRALDACFSTTWGAAAARSRRLRRVNRARRFRGHRW
jgi:hypothetical protein